MIDYFRDNYAWNLTLAMALDMGANMDEIDRASRSLRDRHSSDSEDPAIKFFDCWRNAAELLEAAANKDASAGHLFSAGEKYRRACAIYISAERMPPHTYAPRKAAYDRLLSTFASYVRCADVECSRVEVPFDGRVLPALFVKAEGPTGTAPCMIHFNGLDGIKEFLYLSGFPRELARRGISTLIVDNPGVGEALRKHDLHNSHEAERPAQACVEYLRERLDVDPTRVGIVALSLGGYHVPRALAFEKRLACGVVWGANYAWARLMRRRLSGETSSASVPHLMEHIRWVLGKQTIQECLEEADRFTLDGLLDRITVPILICHGQEDRQIPVEDAVATYDGCFNSPKRDLKVFSAEEGGEQHCSVGNMGLATHYMADWIADVFATRVAAQ